MNNYENLNETYQLNYKLFPFSSSLTTVVIKDFKYSVLKAVALD